MKTDLKRGMKLDKNTLEQEVKRLGEEGKRGWLTPDGEFFESEETPAVKITGLNLGGHEQAALQWLETNDPQLLQQLEDRRIKAGYECWIDTDGLDMIKGFMLAHGFWRVSPE